MRINLSFKFFIAFLSTSFMIVVIMVSAMQFFAYQSFWEYIHKVEATRLIELGSMLGLEYKISKGWDRLRQNPYYWHEIIKPSGSAAYLEKPPSLPSGFEFYLKPAQPLPPPPPPGEARGEKNKERVRRFAEGDDLRQRIDRRVPQYDRRLLPQDDRGPQPRDDRRPPPNDKNHPLPYKQDDQDPRPQHDISQEGSGRPVFSIEHRLTLFDENKKNVIGRGEVPEDHTLQKITVDGKTVGWLGLETKKKLSDPLDTAFLKQQSKAFYIVGALMLVIASIVAFLLSRHMLKPVQELIKGTRSLTSRKFDTRIEVKSSDELGQLAQDFNHMAQTLEHYEQMRQQWISDIAHELRTPLSILRGEIEAIQDGIHEANDKYLESLHDEVVHMIKIVSNLHDLSLAESAVLHIKREPVNLMHTVRGCIRKFDLMFTQRAITVVDELGDKENIIIQADRDRLTQVFSNLLENTLRYTDSPGSLVVSLICTASEIKLIFADTKPGVPAESLDRLFDRLYRVDKSRSRALGGSGLGLSICKTIIEAHNGTIKANLAPEHGLQIIQAHNGVVKGQHEAGGGLQIEIELPLHS
ncbi:MAG: HAMP domain-containing protein [Desulfamplus sp.]|nr:HAMP domain-containing protein [Desulfamplus sp.]